MLTLFLIKKAASDLKLNLDGKAKPAKSVPNHSWLCHLIAVNRRKCYIFINQQSLFSVLVDKKTAGNVFEAFKARVEFWLEKYHIKSESTKSYLKKFDKIDVFKTSDKKFLGHLNDIRGYAKDELYDAVDAKKLPFIFAIEYAEMKINGVPQSKLELGFPHVDFDKMVRGEG